MDGDGRSFHNLYLQTGVQIGWIGLVIFLCLLIAVLRGTVHQVNRRTALAAAVMFGIMTHELFEVSLTQNSWHYGFTYWIIWGIGLSESWLKKENFLCNLLFLQQEE